MQDKTERIFGSTKTWKAVTSTAFRQWRADSHCKFLHGYALTFTAEFEALTLDARNWVMDFGGFKDFKKYLEHNFDHVTVVARDDPFLEWFKTGENLGTLQLRIVDQVGCEAFANLVFAELESWLNSTESGRRVTLTKLEVAEHESNSAFVRVRRL